MAEFATLEISDGTTTISLLQNTLSGFHLSNWMPQIAQAKGGGTFQSSSLSTGRRLASRKFDNIIDSFELKINSTGQNALIFEIQEMLRLLEKATEYWSTDWQNEPVWIKAQAKCEDNARYSLIVNYQWEELNNPYSQPFYTPAQLSVMDNIVLVIEHKHWLALQPETDECAEISSLQTWEYDAEWVVNDSDVLRSGVFSMFQASNGYIYAGDLDTWQSTDNGASWASVDAPGSDFGQSIIQISNGHIFVANGTVIRRSTDNGASWTTRNTIVGALHMSLLELANGTLLCGTSGGDIYSSGDSGASWALLASISTHTIEDIIQLSNGNVLAAVDAAEAFISVSSDNGASWATLFTVPSSGGASNLVSLLLAADGSIYAGGSVSNTGVSIFKSENNGTSWFPSFFRDTIELSVNDIIEDSSNNLWAIGGGSGGATDGRIYKSEDNGQVWFDQAGSFPSDLGLSLLQTSNDDLYAGLTGDDILKRANPNTASMGRSATCNDEVMIANCQPIGNLTHIKIDDGGVFSDIFPATLPQDLLPAIPAVNDAVYFGQDTSVEQTGPFDNLIFDLGTVLTFTNSYTIVWEYWNGAWVTLTVHDETDAGGVFTRNGVQAVCWEQPSDWASTAIDGITAYWVRARVSALSGTITPPTQQNREIYTVVLPYADVGSTVVLGDIPALSRKRIVNRSDEDGRGGSAPNLWDNRIIIGLRSHSRGENFQSYINISDEQNPPGITVTDTGGNTAFATNTTAPTGRIATYNPAGVEAMATQITIAFGASVARDFYGKFHVFLRAQRDAGAITDFDVQLQIISGSGGIQFTTSSKQTQTTTQFELLDFGQIQLPVGGIFKSTDLGNTTEIRIQASAASGTPNLNMYDLILIPVDEWAIDSVDFSNTSDSIVGMNDGIKKMLDIDSTTNLKTAIQSTVKLTGNEQITSIYNSITANEAVLQANSQQKLWFLAAQTDQTGTATAWISPPYILHSAQLFKNERYLGLRGER